MLRLSRTVRCSINPAGDAAGVPLRAPNGYSAVPAMQGLGRHYEFTVTCAGEADRVTGYFINIQDIDRAVRQSLLPIIIRACADTPYADPAHVLRAALPPLQSALGGRVSHVRWNLSPYYSIQMHATDSAAAVIRQRFEFAAAHRLNVDAYTSEQNRAIFGKCNNASGHGHNYVIEPAVSVPLDNPQPFTLAAIEQVVDHVIMQRFDHKNLNTDTPEFGPGALNPSVEHIAKVCYDLLKPAIAAASSSRAALQAVTVWETEKTSCTYPG